MTKNWKWIPFESADEVDKELSDGIRSSSICDKSGNRNNNSIKVPVGEFKVKRAKKHLEGLKSLGYAGSTKEAEVKIKTRIKILEDYLASKSPT